MKSTSVRGTMTSCTCRSEALNTSSTISRSSSVRAAWPATRSSSSSSDMAVRCSFGSIPKRRTIRFVECDKTQIIGRKRLATKSINIADASAICSVRKSAKRFGTSSPNTSEKYAMTKVTPISEAVAAELDCIPISSSHGMT